MCFSSNAIEQEAIKVTEQIKKKTIYKFVKADFINGHAHEDDLNLISRITLEDHSGKKYCIEPNPNGLRFAEGTITFHEYKELERNEKKQGTRLLLLTITVYLASGGAFIWYLL